MLSSTTDGSFTYNANDGLPSGTGTRSRTNAKDPTNLITNTVTVTHHSHGRINDNQTSTGSAAHHHRATGVLANDRGAGLTENTVGDRAGHGTLSINADGSFTYTADAGFSGTTSSPTTTPDTPGQTSNAATVTITVNPGCGR